MHAELLYTSAPQGLKQGSRGFCTVLSTQGMPLNLAQRLEALSMYRHVFAPGDPKSANNPVCYAHLRFSLGGKQVNLISRIADYGLDYSQRTNKLAHHIVVDSPLPPSGPAALLEHSGVMRQSWDGKCDTPPSGPELPSLTISPEPCRAWERLTGDAGWGGVVADAWLKPGGKTVWLVFSESQSSSLLKLMAESIALLPPSARWQATFSTYFTNLPPDVECKVRCVLAGSEEARLAKARGEVIDLMGSLGAAPPSPGVDAARTGRIIGSDVFSSRSSESNSDAPFRSAPHTGTAEPRSPSKSASRSSRSGPPPAPVPQGGRSQLGMPEPNTPFLTQGDPYFGTRKKSARWPVALLLVAGLFLLIFLPLLGGGAVFLAMKFGTGTAASIPEEDNEDDTNSAPATTEENSGDDRNSPDSTNEKETPSEESSNAQTPSQAPPPPQTIKADNFDIDIQLKPPIPEFEKLLWLIEGTEISVVIKPKGTEEEQKKREETWKKDNPPTVEIQLIGTDHELKPDAQYLVTNDDIQSILKMESTPTSIEISAKASMGGDNPSTIEKKVTVEIPQIQVTFNKADIVCLLEPKFFNREKYRDGKRLYDVSFQPDWIKEMGEDTINKWYAHDGKNPLGSSMFIFGVDQDKDDEKVKSELFQEYAQGLNMHWKKFRDSMALPGQPFKAIMKDIEDYARNKDEKNKLVAFESLKTLGELFDHQNESWDKFIKISPDQRQGNFDSTFKPAIDTAEHLRNKFEKPTGNEYKANRLAIFACCEYWESNKNLKFDPLGEQWKRIHDNYTSIAESIEQIETGMVRPPTPLEIRSTDNQKSFKIPVIVKYQPPPPEPPPQKAGATNSTVPDQSGSGTEGFVGGNGP